MIVRKKKLPEKESVFLLQFSPTLPHFYGSTIEIFKKKKKKPVLDLHRTRSTQRGNPIRRYLVIFKVISICI